MEWGWSWSEYWDCWPAKWRMVVCGKSRLIEIRKEAAERG